MANNLEQFARNSLQFRPSDIRLVLERVHSHVVKPRMSAEELLEVVRGLGFQSVEAFGDQIGLERVTSESWARYGLSRDAAQLLLALLNYRQRLLDAMDDFEKITQIPLDGFFENQQLP
ncbi:hypothetical protein [Bosea sp. BH3]|uniref:hypothetical protein n=1 Tax=Bosea sp. BH3 TaxID=2871701 RepID=UPI0021CB413B|nr:hypothetical protein [Bosea sp. BH3]MCU4178810.1 hypothetical protein [Bosea sp. BH3]